MKKEKKLKLSQQQQGENSEGNANEEVTEKREAVQISEDAIISCSPQSKKKLKRKQKNKFKMIDEETSDSTENSAEKKRENEKVVEKSDEPLSKKLKQKRKNKKKKNTYLTLNKDQAVPESSNNEQLFVEMAEWVKFNIPESIIRALYEKGFKTPTKIQSLVLPSALLARKDIVGAAETGSGKTLAFGIPILSGIVNKLENPEEEEDNDSGLDEEEVLEDSPNNETEFLKKKRSKLYALILAPTRELAIQVQNHIIDAGKYFSFVSKLSTWFLVNPATIFVAVKHS